MRTVSYDEFVADFDAVAASVVHDRSPVGVTVEGGPSLVVMSLRDYRELTERVYGAGSV